MIRFLVPVGTLLLASAAQAAEQQPAASAGSLGSLFQVLLGLILVLGLMAGAVWLLKRMGVSGPASANVAKIVGGVSLGNRERVVVVEVADQWIVVGVAQGQVNGLATMPRREVAPPPSGAPAAPNFANWLKQTIDKRNGNT